MTAPLALIAELTHRCPLHCVYCSNPQELTARSEELPTETWARVFNEAAAAGVMQLDLTGGEPLARPDLSPLIQSARTAGLYVNLITSGLPLDEKRLDGLVAAGLDHFQLSFQGAREVTAEEISDTKSHAQKLKVLGWLKSRRVAVTLNFVLHRSNLDQLSEMLSIAENSSASRIEFAHVQYYGWALANRDSLLPTRGQLMRSLDFFQQAEERLRGKIKVEYVVPDYYAKFPKPCMGGWGRKAMLITPRGDAMPCHAASIIPGLRFDNVKEESVQENLEPQRSVSKIPRRRLDAGTLQNLRPPRAGLRRLPLPGYATRRRRFRHRSRLLSLPAAPAHRRHPRSVTATDPRPKSYPGATAMALSPQSRLSRRLFAGSHPEQNPSGKQEAAQQTDGSKNRQRRRRAEPLGDSSRQ
jgi:PqqA peptide cyclase